MYLWNELFHRCELKEWESYAMTAPIIKLWTATATVRHRFTDRRAGVLRTVATLVKGEIINQRGKKIYYD